MAAIKRLAPNLCSKSEPNNTFVLALMESFQSDGSGFQKLYICQAQQVNELAQNLISLAGKTWVVFPLSQHQSKPD